MHDKAWILDNLRTLGDLKGEAIARGVDLTGITRKKDIKQALLDDEYRRNPPQQNQTPNQGQQQAAPTQEPPQNQQTQQEPALANIQNHQVKGFVDRLDAGREGHIVLQDIARYYYIDTRNKHFYHLRNEVKEELERHRNAYAPPEVEAIIQNWDQRQRDQRAQAAQTPAGSGSTWTPKTIFWMIAVAALAFVIAALLVLAIASTAGWQLSPNIDNGIPVVNGEEATPTPSPDNSDDGENDNDMDQPTQTPTPNPDKGSENGTTTTPSQTATCPGDVEVHPGETVEVHPGCSVKGDVQAGLTKDDLTAYFDSDPSTGLLVSCPQGCWIYAEWGANISPRTVENLESEMRETGCENGCDDVKVVTIGEESDGDSSEKPDGSTNRTENPDVNDGTHCGGSLLKHETRLIPAGCIVMGDVDTSPSSSGPWTKQYDHDQEKGLIVVVNSDTWVKAPYGAAVNKMTVDDAKEDLLEDGCGLGDGCDTVKIVQIP